MEYTLSCLFKILPSQSCARRRWPVAQCPPSLAEHRNLATGTHLKVIDCKKRSTVLHWNINIVPFAVFYRNSAYIFQISIRLFDIAGNIKRSFAVLKNNNMLLFGLNERTLALYYSLKKILWYIFNTTEHTWPDIFCRNIFESSKSFSFFLNRLLKC